jgi:hypothetical protein
MVPPALPDLKVISPLPFVIALSNPIIIVVPIETAVAPFAGLKVNGDGGKSSPPAVIVPGVSMSPELPVIVTTPTHILFALVILRLLSITVHPEI